MASIFQNSAHDDEISASEESYSDIESLQVLETAVSEDDRLELIQDLMNRALRH